MFYDKMITFFKNTLKLKDKVISYDEFIKLASDESPKKGVMGSLTNLFS